MKQFYKTTICASLFLFVLLYVPLYGQIEIPEDYNNFTKNYEKVFVQLGKDIIISGETVNYSAYIVNASTHKKSKQSKVLYFEILNYNNQPVFYWRSNITEGKTSGSVEVPDTISKGIYTLRAYTNWMRNIDPYFYFSSRLIITKYTDGDNKEGMSYCSPKIDSTEPITFHPESGALIQGISSKTGCCIQKGTFKTDSVYMLIKDNSGKLADSIFVNNSRWIVFSFKPEPGKTYISEFFDKKNNSIRVEMPVCLQYGYSIKYNNGTGGTDKITIAGRNPESQNNIALNLAIRSRGKVYYKTPLTLKGGIAHATVEPDNLPPGIAYMILSDSHGYILRERLIFVQPSKSPEISIRSQNSSFGKGETINMQAVTKYLENNDDIDISLCVSEITPFDDLFFNKDIAKYLLFSSELKKYIYKPWYTEKILNDDANTVLLFTNINDYLWNLSETVDDRRCNYIMENHGYVLNGNIHSKTTGESFINKTVTLSYIDSIANFNYAKTDSLGNFYFLLDKSFDNKKLILQLIDKGIRKDAAWKIDSKRGNTEKCDIATFSCTPEIEEYLESCRKISLINRVYKDESTENTSETEGEIKNKTDFYGTINYKEYPAEYLELPDFYEISDNLLPAVRFKKKADSTILQIYDSDAELMLPLHGSVFLNSILFNDFEYIATLGSAKIRSIEICLNEKIFGDLSFNGIVSIQTKDLSIPPSYIDKNACVYTNFAYSSSKICMSVNPEKPDNIPDFRQILCLKSYKITDNKNTDITFQTSQLSADYNIIIQGITQSGIPVNLITSINVN